MPEWERMPLGEVLTQDTAYVDEPEPRMYPKLSVKLYGRGVVLDTPVQGSELKMRRHQLSKPGQVILSEIWGKKGAIGLVPADGGGALCTSHFFLFDIDESKVLPEWLGLIFRANHLEDQLNAGARGTTGYAAVRPKHLLATEIPLPPLPEQQRIVARVKGLLAKVEEATRLREEVNGELRKLLNSTIDEFLDGYEETSQPLAELLREGTQNGLSAKPNEDASGTPILRISAATSRKDAYVDESDAKFLRLTDNELQKFQLEEGDLLACRFNGNLHYVGRFALYRAESGQVQVYPDKLIRFRVNREVLLPEYARLALNSTRAREQIEVFCATTAGNIGISAGNLKTISIPVPPVEKQIEFITRVEGLSRHINSAGAFQDQTSTELQALPSAILAQAFAGAL